MITEKRLVEIEESLNFHIEGRFELNNSNEAIIFGKDEFVLVTKKDNIEKTYEMTEALELIIENPVPISTGAKVMDEYTKTYMTLGFVFDGSRSDIKLGLGNWEGDKDIIGVDYDESEKKKLLLDTIIKRVQEGNPKVEVKKEYKKFITL